MVSVHSVANLEMELKFDKEMDAILRRTGRGVLVGDSPPDKPKHIDADEIAAFVENVLPAKTRALYMEHFADCDRCRKILASTMLMAGDAAVPALAPVEAEDKDLAVAAIPWYRKLFRTPNLAIAMGALVLTFGGILGFIVLQNRQAEQNASVARVTENERPQGGPYVGDSATANTAASAANAVPYAANANTNTTLSAPVPGIVSATPGEPSANKPAAPASRPDLSISGGVPADAPATGGEVMLKEEERQPLAKGAAPPPPPKPATTDEMDVARAEKKTEPAKDDDEARFAAKRKQVEARSRDLPAGASKSGPARSGPMNTQQNQINTQNMIEMPVTRVVGGKTFNNRNGAWYDSAYRNQATMNFRRGSEEYKKLDSGLRNIADGVGGTVVLIWKGKAYRIQ